MKKRAILAITAAAMLAAWSAFSADKERDAVAGSTAKSAAPGWIERGFARLERAIERLEAKLSGRERGAMMDGCEDMMGSGGMMGDGMMGGGMMGGGMMGGGMMGGGMMGGGRPNDRWRTPSDRR